MSENCQLCLASCLDGHVLSDGSHYHQRCYDFVLNRRDELAREVSELSGSLHELDRSIAKFSTMFGFVRRIVDSSEHDEFVQRRVELNSLRSKPITELNRMETALRKVWDSWPSYPPDWEERRLSAIGNTRNCPNCYKHTRSLHVHHKTPLSRGGSDRQDNLEVLCEQCHSDEHGGKTFRYDSYRQEGSFSKTINLLGEAIRLGKDVRFSYEKYGGEKTNRSITPKRVAPYEHERKAGRTLCVEGFCHLRKADRVFAIKRISRVRIVD